jgi:hypothetical protein
MSALHFSVDVTVSNDSSVDYWQTDQDDELYDAPRMRACLNC